jgi:hypothetical protein
MPTAAISIGHMPTASVRAVSIHLTLSSACQLMSWQRHVAAIFADGPVYAERSPGMAVGIVTYMPMVFCWP